MARVVSNYLLIRSKHFTVISKITTSLVSVMFLCLIFVSLGSSRDDFIFGEGENVTGL